jgi:hypothetical protein
MKLGAFGTSHTVASAKCQQSLARPQNVGHWDQYASRRWLPQYRNGSSCTNHQFRWQQRYHHIQQRKNHRGKNHAVRQQQVNQFSL